MNRTRALCVSALFLVMLPSLESLGYAFDPITVLGVAKGVADFVGSAASEFGESADAFSELYSEIDEDSTMTDEGRRLVEDIQKVRSLAAEAGYSREQIEALIRDDEMDVTKLSSVLRKLTRIIQTSKRTLKAISRLSGKAQVSQVEGNETEKEMLKLQYNQIAHERRMELAKKKEMLKEKVERKRWIEAHEKEIKKSGGMKWGRVGYYSFPDIDPKFKKAIEIAERYKPYLLSLLLLVFALRSGWISATFGSAEKHGKLLSSLLIFGVWTVAAPLLIQTILEQSHTLSQVITRPEADVATSSVPTEAMPKVSGWFDLYNGIAWAFYQIKIYAFQITEFIFNIGLVMMISIVFIVIFFNTMLNAGMSMATYFNMIIALSMWPLMWNLLGVVAQKIVDSEKLSAGDSIISVLLTLFQLASPVIGYKLLRGRGIGEAVGGALSLAAGMPYQGYGAYKGYQGEKGGGDTGQKVGRGARMMSDGVGNMASGMRNVAQSRRRNKDRWC